MEIVNETINNDINDKINIILVDDHPLVLDGLIMNIKLYDDINIIGCATNGNEALTLAQNSNPDMILMDINMPEMNGIEALKTFKEKYPHIKVLIISMHDNVEYISSALKLGAKGYILKDVASDEIINAIRSVYRGATYFSSDITDILINSENENESITNREEDILILLAEGMSNKEIANKLSISIRTVETHRKNIKHKLGISTTAGLTVFAIKNGLIQL